MAQTRQQIIDLLRLLAYSLQNPVMDRSPLSEIADLGNQAVPRLVETPATRQRSVKARLSRVATMGSPFLQHEIAGMIRVRLFMSGKPVGFVGLDEAKHRMRPEGALSDDSIDVIRKDLEAGRISGGIRPYQRYRQATPFCPLDSAKSCPCDEAICGAE